MYPATMNALCLMEHAFEDKESPWAIFVDTYRENFGSWATRQMMIDTAELIEEAFHRVDGNPDYGYLGSLDIQLNGEIGEWDFDVIPKLADMIVEGADASRDTALHEVDIEALFLRLNGVLEWLGS